MNLHLNTDHLIQRARQTVGFFLMEDWGLIDMDGPDAEKFLQAQTTNDVLGLDHGEGNLQAILDRTGKIKALFSLHHNGRRMWILAERCQIPTLMAHFEQFHFGEDVTFADHSDTLTLLALQGPKALQVVEAVISKPVKLEDYGLMWVTWKDQPFLLLKRSLTGEQGYVLAVPREEIGTIKQALWQAGEPLGMVQLSQKAVDIMRVEAGIAKFGVDINPDTLLTDTGLENQVVSYSKGCYPGQEVVAKVKNRGSSPKSLMGLVFIEGQDGFPPGTPVKMADKAIGTLTSVAHSPTLKAPIALAYLGRDYRTPDQEIEVNINQRNLKARVVSLPFYSQADTQQKAHKIYGQALQRYIENQPEEAVALMREAVSLAPDFLDAQESLGVILSKTGQLDEAIAVMEALTQKAPDEVMPHTNLSMFYMQKGWKEKAEEEKAKATSLMMRQQMNQAMAQEKAKKEQAQKEKELNEKISMFCQVLDMDPDDEMANYGLGNAYVDLKRFDQALAPLEKVLAVNPDYSVAYLALGRAFIGCRQLQKARETLEKGIEVASRKGDQMPLQQMVETLHTIS